MHMLTASISALTSDDEDNDDNNSSNDSALLQANLNSSLALPVLDQDTSQTLEHCQLDLSFQYWDTKVNGDVRIEGIR